MSLDPHEEQYIIKLISCPLSLLSILSTLFVFYLYWFHRKLQIFPFRLVVYLQISDFILAFSQILILFEDYDILDTDFLCQSQAFLMQYGALATIFWSCIISTLMFFSFSHESQIFEKKEYILLIIGFYLPGSIAVMF